MSNATSDVLDLFTKEIVRMPLVAILRGLEPKNALAVADSLYQAGFRIIEVPLNSPNPLKSIELLANKFDQDVLIGAGTVTTVDAVNSVKNAGGQIIVSPNVDTAVIAQTKKQGMISLPGFRTPSEAFSAIGAGADGLKLFPCEDSSPSALKAMCTIVPSNVPLFCVGGIEFNNMEQWLAAGATGFGFGSAIFKDEYTPEQVAEKAKRLIKHFEKDRR